jgi:hypothetical protein
MIPTLTIISSLLFLFYGLFCLFSSRSKKEFIRFKLERFRHLTGLLEILGGVGLLVGMYFSQPIYVISSAGLALLMLLGVAVRVRVKDSVFETFPAFVLMIVNGAIFFSITT